MHGCNDAGIDPVRVVTHALRPPVRASRQATRVGAFALLLAATAAHAAPGRTAATYEVSSTGEASYSIPIAVPPGTAGLTPQLALTYGHRSGTSLAGVGWAITGAFLPLVLFCSGGFLVPLWVVASSPASRPSRMISRACG